MKMGIKDFKAPDGILLLPFLEVCFGKEKGKKKKNTSSKEKKSIYHQL